MLKVNYNGKNSRAKRGLALVLVYEILKFSVLSHRN